ncbi:hypothetical protein PDESU_03924 [Pontiella desulfatans]|uniref:Glycosyl hydrolase family 95 N-terminal domain-containing protein n=1 Tax=Pontiella desulfatans TaxID=2750659 RepID=A0A6C2U734_PONDE|nr:alpha-L-fucosidase [Pontiella desulfatans]VGO15341.1 hypothetical protein PDESU_03924 [Pontiella desulfatans]
MKHVLKLGLFGLCVAAASAAGRTLDVDWPDQMAGQDLQWNSVPEIWDEAPFIGNGVMGSMIFREDGSRLVIQIGRGDVQEHRMASGQHVAGNVLPDSSRLPVGYFTLDTVGEIKGCDLRLNLWDAEITGTVSTDRGELGILAFIHSGRNLLVVETKADSGEAGFAYSWHPEEAFCPRVKGKRKGGKEYRPEYDGNPDPVVTEGQGLNTCVQTLRGGGVTATAWAIATKGREKTLLASVGHTYPEANALELATANVGFGKKTPLDALLKGHRRWWHAFWPESFVSLPDARMESFLWVQHYKMACTTKGGNLLADNQGVWMQPVTGWPGLWWNLNVQLAYSHLLPANHPELSLGLVEHLHRYRDNLAKNVPEEMRADSAAINTVSGQDLLSPIGDPRTGGRGLSTGNLTWAMHNAYMQYRYTMDEALLRHKIFPLLKRAINYYFHFMIEGEDGRIHLPRTSSPEYGDAEDCNYDLALLRWGCGTLIDICGILKVEDPLLPKWRDVLERLTPYPVDETGFMIGKGVPYAKSHRHYSQLLMLYPLCMMDLDDPEQRALAMKSLKHWQSYPEALAGYSYTGSSSMFSLFGDGEMAERRMQDFFNDKLLPNTFYKEGSPVIETPPAGARSILDMLIQSWGDTIRVFPAIPEAWADVSFADLRTEGAFLVSAVLKNGKTAFISIESLAGAPCRVRTGIKGEIKVDGIDAKDVVQLGDGLVELALPKGATAILSDAAYKGDFNIEPVAKTRYADWRWGLSGEGKK